MKIMEIIGLTIICGVLTVCITFQVMEGCFAKKLDEIERCHRKELSRIVAKHSADGLSIAPRKKAEHTKKNTTIKNGMKYERFSYLRNEKGEPVEVQIRFSLPYHGWCRLEESLVWKRLSMFVLREQERGDIQK